MKPMTGVIQCPATATRIEAFPETLTQPSDRLFSALPDGVDMRAGNLDMLNCLYDRVTHYSVNGSLADLRHCRLETRTFAEPAATVSEVANTCGESRLI